MVKMGAAVLVLAGVLGARGAAREIAAPFDSFDRLVRSSEPRLSVPEPELEAAIPTEPLIEPEPESESVASAIDESPDNYDWDQWRSQAVQELPENLQVDSDYVRAINQFYLQAVGGSFHIKDHRNTFTNWEQRGGEDIEVMFLSDIGVLDEFFPPDLESEKLWTAYWEDWRARAMAALPEAERNDPNRLKEIDTTLELVKQGAGRASLQETQWKQIGIEVEVSQQRAHVATK